MLSRGSRYYKLEDTKDSMCCNNECDHVSWHYRAFRRKLLFNVYTTPDCVSDYGDCVEDSSTSKGARGYLQNGEVDADNISVSRGRTRGRESSPKRLIGHRRCELLFQSIILPDDGPL